MLVIRLSVVVLCLGTPIVLGVVDVLIVLVLVIVIGVAVFVRVGHAVRMRVRMQVSFGHLQASLVREQFAPKEGLT